MNKVLFSNGKNSKFRGITLCTMKLYKFYIIATVRTEHRQIVKLRYMSKKYLNNHINNDNNNNNNNIYIYIYIYIISFAIT